MSDATLRRLRTAILVGQPSGKRLLAIRRMEAMIDQAEAAMEAILTASPCSALDPALDAIMAAAWQALEDGSGDDGSVRRQRLQSAWFSRAMPDQDRWVFERYAVTSDLWEQLRVRHPGLQPERGDAVPVNLDRQVDDLVALLRRAAETEKPRECDAAVVAILLAQRRALGIPNGPGAPERLQALRSAYGGDMPEADRHRLERHGTTLAIQLRLRSAHPELLHPEPPPAEDEGQLEAQLDDLAPALREAQAHTVPGMITTAWLDTLAGLLTQLETTLAATPDTNRRKAKLCSTMAGAFYALARGREQLLQPKLGMETYVRAADLYAAAGEPGNAAAAREKAAWLCFALKADVDGGTFDDLRRVVDGVPDALDRAATLGRLSAQATQANDHSGALRYAEVAFTALAEAGFPDPSRVGIAPAIAAWVEAAASRCTGDEILPLIQRVGEQVMDLLRARHTAAIRADPAGAGLIEGALAGLATALRLTAVQSKQVTAEITDGLRPYIELEPARDDTDEAAFDALQMLQPAITALDAVAQAEAEPPADARETAAALVAAAERFGQPGPIALARRVEAILLQRAGDLDGADVAAEAGEVALLPDGAGPDDLVDPSMFETFLMLRYRRCDIAAAAKSRERTLELAEGAIRAIEADRYRISDPFQQAGFLANRTRFYEWAAVSAYRLERWDTLVEVMDLVKARGILRGRLAHPPAGDAADLAQQVERATAAIEAAASEEREALRDRRRKLWSLRTIARMRSTAGQDLPILTVAALQASLAPDEASISWLWLTEDVLLVFAFDRSRVHAEHVVLTPDQKDALSCYVDQVRSGRMPRQSMDVNVQPIAEAMLPPATRMVIAGAKRLILSPHRALHLVPVHAAQFDGRFLIEQASIRYVPNLGSLLLPWHGTKVGTTISVGIDTFGRGLPPLAQAEAEAEAVASAWTSQGTATTALIGAAATRDAFTGLDLRACRCVHLATHGESVFANALHGDPFASRLCFADGDLEALSLAALPLQADVVVMSACHSGQRALALPSGDALPGDDLFGLQAALFQAGVRSVIGALWTVDDASAMTILPELHRRLAAGVRPEQALQNAILTYLQAPDTRKAIYFWAPLFMSSIGRLSDPIQGANT